jgi:hypothetical protein
LRWQEKPEEILDTVKFTVIVDYNTTSSITSLEIAVPIRLIRLSLLAASLSVAGAAVVALSDFGLNPSPIVTTAVADRQSGPAELTVTLLPTVMVHPEPDMPTLETVTVRPSRTELADVAGRPVVAISAASMPVLIRRPTAHLMSSAGFDMPYYSFGKTLRHVSKE